MRAGLNFIERCCSCNDQKSFTDVLCSSLSSRDFQFGHMDGNDYINSLIMG